VCVAGAGSLGPFRDSGKALGSGPFMNGSGS